MQPRTRLVTGAFAVGAVVAVAGGVLAAPAISQSGDDQELTGKTRDRAVDAALKVTGGGTVTETEMGDDGAAYGVEILLPDGRQIEVNLDRDMNVIGQEADDDGAGSETDD